MILVQFSSMDGLGETTTHFGTRGPVFKSWLYLSFFLVKMLHILGVEPGALNPKSAMLTLRQLRLKFWSKKIFVSNSTGWET